jgi:hypothetical protein
MRILFLRSLIASFLIWPKLSYASIFGEETAVLIQMAGTQLKELSHLAESVGIAKDQRDFLIQINDGVDKTVQQIQSIESIVERAQGVDPTAIRNLTQLNDAIDNTKSISNDVQELLSLKMYLCDEAIEEAGLQSDTTYKTGQEMEDLGSRLSEESKTASPGRAQQISASASSAQMLAMGVELQTLAQMSQLLAMSLDLQKAQIQRDLHIEKSKRAYLRQALTGKSKAFTEIKQSNRQVKKGRGI